MSSLVSYGNLRPAFIGALGVIFGHLLKISRFPNVSCSLKRVDEIIAFSDSGIWGDESIDPDSDFRVFRVSDFKGDFELNLNSPPFRSIPVDKQEKYCLKGGDILIVKSSGSAKQVVSGRVAVFDVDTKQPYAGSNFLLRLRPSSDMNPHYLAYALGSPPIREEIADSVKTMTYPNLSFKLYRKLRVPVVPLPDQIQIADFLRAFYERKELPELPAYLDEQRRIVQKIETLATKIEEARHLRHRCAIETASFYVTTARKLFSEYQKDVVKIGEVFRVTTGGTPSRANPAYWGGKIPWVSSGEVAFCRIKDTNEKITELGEAESNAKRYPQNTVLLAMIGQGKTRGQCAILDCEASTNQNVAAIHVPETEHAPAYVYHWLVSRYLESRSTETGTAQPALSGRRVREIPIPLPTPKDQHRIVTYLDKLQVKIDSLKTFQERTSTELDALIPSILSKAFNGEL